MSGKRQVHYVVPVELQEKLRQFMQENDFRNEREALSALIEAALDAYPKWGVRKGIARVVSNNVRAAVRVKVLQKLTEVANEIRAELNDPSVDDMEVDPNAGFIE